MRFVVAIPSYQRVRKLREKTLPYLRKENIPKDSITIFVVAEEKEAYEAGLDPQSYGKIVVGLPTIAGQRQFMESYYEKGQWVLFIDDDIRQIKFLNPQPLLPFVERMFEITAQENLHLWSIQPANNLYFCKDKVQIGKIFCVGCFYGLINEELVYPPISSYEDKFRSLTWYKRDGATVRYTGACPDTIYFAAGGLSEHRKKKYEEDTKKFLELFEGECKYVEKRTGGDVVWRNLTMKEESLFNVS